MIRCFNLSLAFQGRHLFKDLNFEVSKGQHLCLSGGSGTGKSTVLKLLMGFVLPDRGEVSINGQKLSENTVHRIRKDIVWIPQNVNLPVRNGDQLIELMDVEDRRSQIGDLLDRLGLSDSILITDFSKVSGGEKQRIIIAVLLSLNKSILLMDEPTSSLDEKSIQCLIQVVNNMKETTIISSSHNLTWVDRADKVIQL